MYSTHTIYPHHNPCYPRYIRMLITAYHTRHICSPHHIAQNRHPHGISHGMKQWNHRVPTPYKILWTICRGEQTYIVWMTCSICRGQHRMHPSRGICRGGYAVDNTEYICRGRHRCRPRHIDHVPHGIKNVTHGIYMDMQWRTCSGYIVWATYCI